MVLQLSFIMRDEAVSTLNISIEAKTIKLLIDFYEEFKVFIFDDLIVVCKTQQIIELYLHIVV